MIDLAVTGSLLERMPRPLLVAAVVHVVLAALCAVALCATLPPVVGAHPFLKPLKFSVSIALFLATLAVLLPSVTTSPAVRSTLAWTFALTMAIEMLPILGQALRGTTSHFNTSDPLNAAIWNLMIFAIVVATVAMVTLTALATFRPLSTHDGQAMPPVLALAWRVALWLLLLAPVSGFAMGHRMQHSVGGLDGGAGLPFVRWSVLHGDLRVAHFFALHALQVLPLTAWVLLRVATPQWLRWGALTTMAAAMGVLCVGTLAQAFRGRPFIGADRSPSMPSLDVPGRDEFPKQDLPGERS